MGTRLSGRSADDGIIAGLPSMVKHLL